MDRLRLEHAASEYTNLRGLFALPAAVLFVASALGNLAWGPFAHDWFLVGVLVAASGSALWIDRYYRRSFGRVSLTRREQVRAGIAAAVFAPALLFASLLLRSRVSWSLDWPVNPTSAMIGLGMIAVYAVTVGLYRHHVVVFGLLVLVSLAPIWHGDDPDNVGLLLSGLAVLVNGLLDHRLLMRSFGPAPEVDDAGV
jgi:hypothetical protein